jgi:hypothetical protein
MSATAIAQRLTVAAGLKPYAVDAYLRLSTASIRSAVREQHLSGMIAECQRIVPSLRDQYTHASKYPEFTEFKIRAIHAFQTQLMLRAVQVVATKVTDRGINVADIGDSAGNHCAYLRALSPIPINHTVSVNLDPIAVEKVKSKGGHAVLCRAEDLSLDTPIDLFLSFETVEHLTDPTRFLHQLAVKGGCDHLLVTVPWRRVSQVGLHELRGSTLPERLTAEGMHIFELCPQDWLLLARFSGWKPIFTQIYRQYPRFSPLRVLAPMWRSLDFEGFWGVMLTRDLLVADRYKDW